MYWLKKDIQPDMYISDTAKWLLDICGGNGLEALKVGIYRKMFGNGILKEIVLATKLSEEDISNLILKEFSENEEMMLAILADSYLRKIIWTIYFQLKHLLKISKIMNQPLFDIALLSPLYDTQLLDLLLQLGHTTISGTTIRLLLLSNNLLSPVGSLRIFGILMKYPSQSLNSP